MTTKRLDHSLWLSPKTLGDHVTVIAQNNQFYGEHGRLQRSRIEEDGRTTVLIWFQVNKTKGHLVMMDWTDVQRTA